MSGPTGPRRWILVSAIAPVAFAVGMVPGASATAQPEVAKADSVFRGDGVGGDVHFWNVILRHGKLLVQGLRGLEHFDAAFAGSVMPLTRRQVAAGADEVKNLGNIIGQNTSHIARLPVGGRRRVPFKHAKDSKTRGPFAMIAWSEPSSFSRSLRERQRFSPR